jgi:hypothetical protein
MFDLLNDSVLTEKTEPEPEPEPEITSVPDYVVILKNTDIGMMTKHDKSITKIILINCPNLRYINCEGRWLEYVEIINCPKLKMLPDECINLKTLIIKGSSGIRRIADDTDSLEYLTLHNSDIVSFPKKISSTLKSINLEECVGITSIGGNNYTNLISIRAFNCANLSGFTGHKLQHIYFEDCPVMCCPPSWNYDTIFIKNCPNMKH